MISEEMKEKNYILFKKKLETFGVSGEKVDEIFGDKLKNASFALTNEYGLAYDGSLVHVILRTLTPFAIKINDLLNDNIKVNQDSLIKVCLLHQISKAFMFTPNDNEWEKEKRGMMYKYAPSKVGLKMGLKSVLLAQKLGVTFEEEEVEAMTILDRSSDDNQAKFFSTPLSTVLKEAAELTYLTNRFNNE